MLKELLECLWMKRLYDEQKEYNKTKLLNPKDDDWRREILK